MDGSQDGGQVGKHGTEIARNGAFARWDVERGQPEGWTLWSTAGTGCIRRASRGGLGNIRVNPASTDTSDGGAIELVHRDAERTALFQDVSDREWHRNESYTFTVWLRASRAGAVFLSVDDGVHPHNSAPNRAAEGWERLSVSGIVSHQATKLRLHVWLSAACVAQVRNASLRTELRPKRPGPPSSLDDLSETPPDEQLPPLDRRHVSEMGLTAEQSHWREHGYLILPRCMPDSLIEAYCRVREKLDHPNGYPTVNPYVEIEEIRDLGLHPPLTSMLEHLIGEPMGMSLALTGWVSSERDWHQDDYLNPSWINGWYAAVWIALDDIDPDAGPFEFVPASHHWPLVRRDKLFDYLDPEERTKLSWPQTSEELLVPLLEQKLVETGLEPKRFIAAKGDVLIWHARLLHRGSRPRNSSLLRKALIAHFISIHRHLDAPMARSHRGRGYYF